MPSVPRSSDALLRAGTLSPRLRTAPLPEPPARVGYFLEEGRFPTSQTGCDVEQFLADLCLSHCLDLAIHYIETSGGTPFPDIDPHVHGSEESFDPACRLSLEAV